MARSTISVYQYIENCKDKEKLFCGIREILCGMPEWKYPEDWEIKRIQALADAKYIELGGDL